MSLAENIARVRANIAAAAREVGRDPAEITLVAATKVQSSQTIRDAIAAGITVCGENRVQELSDHLSEYAYDGARIHFIGHLQTNKVKQVTGRVDLIESVGSEHLLREIAAQAERLGIVQDILLQVNIGTEEQKNGLYPEDLPAFVHKMTDFTQVRLRGLMAVPPIADIPGKNRVYFAEMHHLFVDIRTKLGNNDLTLDCLSMGMSGDYEDAVREGATLVRVGTALFGPRPSMASQIQG